MTGDAGARFENFVAGCLLKHTFGLVDYRAENYSLNYLQTKEKKEVDFALVKDNEIEKIIEVKLSDHNPSSNLSYFHNKYQLPAMQLVKNLKRQQKSDHIEILDAHKYLKGLFL